MLTCGLHEANVLALLAVQLQPQPWRHTAAAAAGSWDGRWRETAAQGNRVRPSSDRDQPIGGPKSCVPLPVDKNSGPNGKKVAPTSDGNQPIRVHGDDVVARCAGRVCGRRQQASEQHGALSRYQPCMAALMLQTSCMNSSVALGPSTRGWLLPHVCPAQHHTRTSACMHGSPVALGSSARGRMPLHADCTSDRRTCGMIVATQATR